MKNECKQAAVSLLSLLLVLLTKLYNRFKRLRGSVIYGNTAMT